MSEWHVTHENFHTKHSMFTAPDEHMLTSLSYTLWASNQQGSWTSDQFMTNIGKQREIQKQTDRQTDWDRQTGHKKRNHHHNEIPFVRQICFVPYKHDNNITSSFCPHIIDPFGCLVERVCICKTKNKHSSKCVWVCLCVCAHVWMFVWVHMWMFVCTYVWETEGGRGRERERGRQGGRERARENKFSQSRYILYNCNKLFPRFWREWIMGQGLINYVTNAV